MTLEEIAAKMLNAAVDAVLKYVLSNLAGFLISRLTKRVQHMLNARTRAHNADSGQRLSAANQDGTEPLTQGSGQKADLTNQGAIKQAGIQNDDA